MKPERPQSKTSRKSTKTTRAMANVALALISAIGVNSDSAVAQAKSPAKMEDVFKNIQALRGYPADQMTPTMIYFEASLGVGCGYCHDSDHSRRDLDTQGAKKITRTMIKLVEDINRNSFNGRGEVTCFTCHQGRVQPIAMPFVAGSPPPPALGEEYNLTLPKPPGLPSVSVDQLFAKYRAALGGTQVIQKVAMLIAKGRVTQRRPGHAFPSASVEICVKSPERGIVVTGAGKDEQKVAYDRGFGWSQAGGGNLRDLSKAEIDIAKLEDPFDLPGQLTQIMSDLEVVQPETTGNRQMHVVAGRTQGLPLVKLYFDEDSGILTRLVYYTESAFGSYPTQIEYADFRDLNGLKIPYRWVISQTRNREYTYEMDSVQATATSDSRFAKPILPTNHAPD